MFGRLFKKRDPNEPQVHKVKLPDQPSAMYFDKEKGRWRERGKEHLEEEETALPPPPSMGSAAVTTPPEKKEEKKEASALDNMIAPPNPYGNRFGGARKHTAPATVMRPMQDLSGWKSLQEWTPVIGQQLHLRGGLPGLAAVAHELGYGVKPGGGHPPVPPPVRTVGEEAMSPKTKRLKGKARIKQMVKSSMWDWKGSSLDPVFRRPRIGLKRKREESESSDSSAKTVSEGLSDQEDLFPEEAQSRHISRKCPGLLARHAISEARKRVLADLGEESAHQTPRPVFVRYFRQVFDHSGASTPMKREYLTLAHCLDSLLEGNVLKCLDIAVQRLKAVEQISQGVHPGTANRMEIIPAEGFSLASAEEKRTVAQEHRRELKTNSNLNSWGPHSWYPRGKGGGKPIADDAGVKGEKGGKGPLLTRWIRRYSLNSSKGEVFDSSKHHSMAEVFPLPMPAVDESACEHAWAEAAVRALNWLAVGVLSLGEGPCTVAQESLLRELVGSLGVWKSLADEHFDSTPIESYWKSRSVNGYGEEVHSALSFTWANVMHSLPKRELAGALDGASVASGGIKDFLTNPMRYLKPESDRTWMTTPRVMVAGEDWPEVAAGLVERRICDVIPLSQVLHVQGHPVLGGLFGVPKMEEVDGIPVFRLIMDLRPINQLFDTIAGDLHTLPMLSQLFPLEIFPEDNILVSSEDIKELDVPVNEKKRVVESAFGSTEFVNSVEDIGDVLVKGWACSWEPNKMLDRVCTPMFHAEASNVHDFAAEGWLHQHVPEVPFGEPPPPVDAGATEEPAETSAPPAAAAPPPASEGFGAPVAAPMNPFAPRSVTGGSVNPHAPKGFRESARRQEKSKEKKQPPAKVSARASPFATSPFGQAPAPIADPEGDPEGAGEGYLQKVMKRSSTHVKSCEEDHAPPAAVPPSPLRTSLPAYSPFAQPSWDLAKLYEVLDAARNPEGTVTSYPDSRVRQPALPDEDLQGAAGPEVAATAEVASVPEPATTAQVMNMTKLCAMLPLLPLLPSTAEDPIIRKDAAEDPLATAEAEPEVVEEATGGIIKSQFAIRSKTLRCAMKFMVVQREVASVPEPTTTAQVMNMTKLCAMVPLLPSTAEDPIIRKDAAEDPLATAEAQLLFVQTGLPDDYLTRRKTYVSPYLITCAKAVPVQAEPEVVEEVASVPEPATTAQVMNMTKLCAMVPLLPSTAEDPIIRKDAAEDPLATAEAQLLFVQTGLPDDYLTRRKTYVSPYLITCAKAVPVQAEPEVVEEVASVPELATTAQVMNMTKLCAMVPLLPSTAEDPIIRKDAAEDPLATAEAQLLFVQTGLPDDYLTRRKTYVSPYLFICAKSAPVQAEPEVVEEVASVPEPATTAQVMNMTKLCAMVPLLPSTAEDPIIRKDAAEDPLATAEAQNLLEPHRISCTKSVPVQAEPEVVEEVASVPEPATTAQVMNMTKLCAMVPLLPSTAEDPIIRKDAAEDPLATAEAQLLFVQTGLSDDYLTRLRCAVKFMVVQCEARKVASVPEPATTAQERPQMSDDGWGDDFGFDDDDVFSPKPAKEVANGHPPEKEEGEEQDVAQMSDGWGDFTLDDEVPEPAPAVAAEVAEDEPRAAAEAEPEVVHEVAPVLEPTAILEAKSLREPHLIICAKSVPVQAEPEVVEEVASLPEPATTAQVTKLTRLFAVVPLLPSTAEDPIIRKDAAEDPFATAEAEPEVVEEVASLPEPATTAQVASVPEPATTAQVMNMTRLFAMVPLLPSTAEDPIIRKVEIAQLFAMVPLLPSTAENPIIRKVWRGWWLFSGLDSVEPEVVEEATAVVFVMEMTPLFAMVLVLPSTAEDPIIRKAEPGAAEEAKAQLQDVSVKLQQAQLHDLSVKLQQADERAASAEANLDFQSNSDEGADGRAADAEAKLEELQAQLQELQAKLQQGNMPAECSEESVQEALTFAGENCEGKHIDSLIGLLGKHISNLAVCSQVCAALENLTFTDVDNQSRIVDLGGIELILKVLETYEDADGALLRPVVDSLWNLTFNAKAVERATATGGVRRVASVLAKNLATPEVLGGVCAVLLNLAVVDENRHQIVQCGGAESMVQAVKAHQGREEVVEHACQALYLLAYHTELRPSVVAANAAEAAALATTCGGPRAPRWGRILEEARARPASQQPMHLMANRRGDKQATVQFGLGTAVANLRPTKKPDEGNPKKVCAAYVESEASTTTSTWTWSRRTTTTEETCAGVQEILDDWSKMGSKTPRASFFTFDKKPQRGHRLPPNRVLDIRHEKKLEDFFEEVQKHPRKFEHKVGIRRKADFNEGLMRMRKNT
ncbi:Protein aardvark [Symbiodinium microadriaticum]|uniref:Protein aardvark n=1 Tax=Symbiodinium microadriaticum TaxID=2951 RepID=A0A1Q9D597_SYMMI|nr:Protein aardvark [Symbiodinium microadriaticum]